MMNKRQKEVLQAQLDNEKEIIKDLKYVFGQAQDDVVNKIIDLSRRQDMENLQTIIYQQQYQQALKGQIDAVLDQLHGNEFTKVSEYLTKCYRDGYLGTMYDLHGQGIPLIMPIDQEQVAQAIQTDAKLSQPLYERMGEDINDLKRNVRMEVSRGVITGATWNQIADNLSKGFKNTPFDKAYNKSIRIARTEGHRIQQTAAYNAQEKAKENGANVVKQWDATLDSRTRPSHMEVDGEIRETDEAFSNGLMYPGDPSGDASEVINCRCTLTQRAKWALDEDELDALKERAEYFGLDKTKNFEEFTEKYLKSSEENTSGDVTSSVKDINSSSTQMLEEAYENHRIQNNLNSVPVSELGEDSPISVDYRNMSVESAEAFHAAFNDLTAEYDTTLMKVRMMTKDEAKWSNAFASTIHDYTVDTSEIVINPFKCNDYDKMTSRIKELSDSGYAVKVRDELVDKYIATHEFAHTLINTQDALKDKTNWVNADYKKIKKARKEINKVYEEYTSELEYLTNKQEELSVKLASGDIDESIWDEAVKITDQINATKISDYSLENADEFLAESFTNERIGVKSNKYAKSAYDILNKYFKR